MTDEERVIQALNRWTFGHYEKQVFSDLPDAARAVLAALGPQLTAEEAQELLDVIADAQPQPRKYQSERDAIARLSLIANGEKP